MHHISGILLAAGNGERFGGHKLLHPLTDGTPLGVAAARHLLAVLPDSIAVVREDDEVLSGLLSDEGMTVITCANAHLGMGASLATGVLATFGVDAWVIALADMPFVRSRTIWEIATLMQRGALLAAPFYQGQRGHPVGVSQMFRDELLRLTGDQGAREVLANYSARLKRHEVDDPGVLIDVDVPADIAGCLS